mgnify:CR=1 FL=1
MLIFLNNFNFFKKYINNVYIKKAGLKSIIVRDNGDGIDVLDLKIAFDRHTTSKISSQAQPSRSLEFLDNLPVLVGVSGRIDAGILVDIAEVNTKELIFRDLEMNSFYSQILCIMVLGTVLLGIITKFRDNSMNYPPPPLFPNVEKQGGGYS